MGRFGQVTSGDVSCDSYTKVVWDEWGTQLYGFSGSVSIKKLDWHLPFFLSPSNRNRGKAFAVLSKKKKITANFGSINQR